MNCLKRVLTDRERLVCSKQERLCVTEVNGEQQWWMHENSLVLSGTGRNVNVCVCISYSYKTHTKGICQLLQVLKKEIRLRCSDIYMCVYVFRPLMGIDKNKYLTCRQSPLTVQRQWCGTTLGRAKRLPG